MKAMHAIIYYTRKTFNLSCHVTAVMMNYILFIDLCDLKIVISNVIHCCNTYSGQIS